ncbi:uncharacterized protein LOC134685307 [Mytilus trossulus]|uniref:uncharacterized protein LOC134685307 n=1 Tax=Mytilus trossulus TaxID=6551 RepID=UPI0030064801
MGQTSSVQSPRIDAVPGTSRGRTASIPGTTEGFKAIIENIRQQQHGRKKVISVNRDDVKSVMFPYLKSTNSEFCPLDITFECDGVSEKAVDLGGPSRELFTLLFQEFLQSNLGLFEGKGGFVLPVNNRKAIDAHVFRAFGKAVVLSLSTDPHGPGFPYFPSFIVSYLIGREYIHELSSLFLVNEFLKQFITDITNATTQNDLDEVMGNDDERFTDNCGWPGNERVTMSNRWSFVQTLLQWDLVDKRRTALEDMKKGLNTFNFLDDTKSLPEFERIFLLRNKQETTANFIQKKLIPEVKKLQTENQEEEKAQQQTVKCLQILEDEEAAYLFQFITGLDDVPPYNFSIQVAFNRKNKKATLPEAITCIQRLLIPLGNKSRLDFYKSFDIAIKMGRLGFSDDS